MPRIPVAQVVGGQATPILVVDDDLLTQRKLEAKERARIVAEGELKLKESEHRLRVAAIAKTAALEQEVVETKRRAVADAAAYESGHRDAVAEAQRREAAAESERREAEWVRDNPIEAQIREVRRRQEAEEHRALEQDRDRAAAQAAGTTLKVMAGAAVGAVAAYYMG